MYTFQTLLHYKRGFPQVQFLFTFKSYALTLIWLKSLSRGWPLYALRNLLYDNTESPVFLLGPNESRDTQRFDNSWILQPMEYTITAAEYMHQCCIISTFERSIFTSSL